MRALRVQAGDDFAFDDSGAPVLTDPGRIEPSGTGAGWHLVSSSAPPLFSEHGSEEFATVARATQEKIVAAMLPTLDLYSPTAAAEGTLARDTFLAGVSDIVLVRRHVRDLTNVIADWRNSAGEQMRAEFQAALQKQ